MNPLKQFLGTIWELTRRFLFPDFSNRVTMLVLVAGISLVAIPQELQVALTNWVIRLVNRTGWLGTLPQLAYQPDPMGYFLIGLALVHNLANRYLVYRFPGHDLIANKQRETDRDLRDRLRQLLPSTGNAVVFLRDHDFSNSFHRSNILPLYDFVATWDNAEHEFLNTSVESARKRLYDAMSDITMKIAKYTAPRYGDFFTVVPDSVNQDGPWPEYVKNEVRELNEAASLAYRMHQEFVREARKL